MTRPENDLSFCVKMKINQTAILLTGPQNSGKTELVRLLANLPTTLDTSEPAYTTQPDLAVDLKVGECVLPNGSTIKLDYYDTSGHPKHTFSVVSCYNMVACLYIVHRPGYDITQHDNDARRYGNPKALVCDVTTYMGPLPSYAQQQQGIGCKYHVSLTTGEGISSLKADTFAHIIWRSPKLSNKQQMEFETSSIVKTVLRIYVVIFIVWFLFMFAYLMA